MEAYCAARKLLNRASVDHTILKQPLALCSDNIEDVSLSSFRRVVSRKEGDQDNKTTRTEWVLKYVSTRGTSHIPSLICHNCNESE
jgi:hypothetical protein